MKVRVHYNTTTIGLPTILFLVFLVLQLTDHIDWPWYAVAAPLLVPIGLFVGVFIAFGLFALLAVAYDAIRSR